MWLYFMKKGKGHENYRKNNEFMCQVNTEEKRLVKFKEAIWYVACLIISHSTRFD